MSEAEFTGIDAGMYESLQDKIAEDRTYIASLSNKELIEEILKYKQQGIRDVLTYIDIVAMAQKIKVQYQYQTIGKTTPNIRDSLIFVLLTKIEYTYVYSFYSFFWVFSYFLLVTWFINQTTRMNSSVNSTCSHLFYQTEARL